MTRLSDNKRERKQRDISRTANAPGADIETLITCILHYGVAIGKVWRIDRVPACRILKSYPSSA
jgi:hypothetical protein